MLSLQERHQVLLFLRHICRAKLLPAEVNSQGWELQPRFHTAGRSAWISKIFYTLLVAQALYKSLSLVYVLLFAPGVPLHQIIIHAVLAAACGTFAYWYYVLYIKHADMHAGLVQMTLTGNIGKRMVDGLVKNNDDTVHPQHPGYRRFLGRSLQELIVICLPTMGAATVLAIGACFLYEREMKVQLYAALPQNYKNWLSFYVCWLEELHMLWMFVAIVGPFFQLQVMAFDLLTVNLEAIGKDFIGREYPVARIQEAYTKLRHQQLYILMLNAVNRNLIFTSKLLCMGVGIMTGYAAIAHFNDHPIFGIMYYIMFLDVMLIYCIIYAKAFKVPLLVREATIALEVGANRVGNKAERYTLRRQLRAIPPLGIQVGNFHTLERTSTPVFLHYVLTNVVNMLVAYG